MAGVRSRDVRLEVPAPAGEPASLPAGGTTEALSRAAAARGGGPVYRWDPLFSGSDAVLKAVRAGTRQLQRYRDQELAQWHEATHEAARERTRDVEREARGDTAPGTAAANAASADAAAAAATARAQRSRKLNPRQVQRILPGLLPAGSVPSTCARARVFPKSARGPLEARCRSASRRARGRYLRRAVLPCAASFSVLPVAQSWTTPSKCSRPRKT